MDPQTFGLHTLRAREARYFAGTALSPCRRYVSGVLLRVTDRGLDARFETVHQLNVRVPQELRHRLAEILDRPGEPAGLGEASRYVTELQIVNIERLLHDAGHDAMNLVAIGQSGCDLWSEAENLGRTVVSLAGSQALAGATGVSVVDRFHERDLAAGGSGGPIQSLPLWLLLTQAKDSNSERPQVVVHLDDTLEIFHLPPRRRGREVPEILWAGLGTGYGLVDRLAAAESWPGGGDTLAEICRDQEVQSRWRPPAEVHREIAQRLGQNDPEQPPPGPAECERVLAPIWIERVCQTLENIFPGQPQPARVLVLGRGGRREPLITALAEALRPLPVLGEPKLGWIAGAPQAAIMAIFAALHVDQVCGNLPQLTGAQSPRILGSISPGTPANWRTVLQQMQAGAQQRMPLRSAV